MAKKTATASETASKAATPTLAGAIRQALKDIGGDPDKADKAKVGNRIRDRYPALNFKESTLSSSLSNVKKELRGNGGKAPSTRARRARGAADPMASELMAV